MLLSVILCNYVDEGNIHKVKDLLFSIEDLTLIQDYDFRTPLHIAAVKNRSDIAHLLINRGAKVNAIDRWKKTPLQEAIVNSSKKVIKILTNNLGTIGLQGMELAAYLGNIVIHKDSTMLDLVLLTDVNVNCADYDGRTPLHVAGDLGLFNQYNSLLGKGADITKKDRWG